MRGRPISPAARDAIRHMIIAGIRPRDVAYGIGRAPQRAVIQPRKRAGERRP